MNNIPKNTNFKLIWFGQLMSIFGSRFSDLALPWIVLEQTGSPLKTGLVALCQHVGPIFLAIPIGNWIETKNKKKVALFSDFIRFITVGIMVIAAYYDALSYLLIAVLLFILGIAGLFFRVSFNSMLPTVFRREELVDVNNYIEGADAISTLIGPSMAGLSLAYIGASWTLAFDAVSFFISFITLYFITYTFFSNKNESENDRNLISNTNNKIFQGIKYLFGNNAQKLLTLTQFTLYFAGSSVGFLVLVLAKEELNLNSAMTGIILSCAGIGNIIGVFLLDKLKGMSWTKLLGTIILMSSLGVVLLALSRTFFFCCAGMFLFDGALSMAFVLYGTARQAITPNRVLARVNSAGVILSSGTILLTTPTISSFAEFNGSKLPLILCAIVMVITAAAFLFYPLSNQSIKDLKPLEIDN